MRPFRPVRWSRTWNDFQAPGPRQGHVAGPCPQLVARVELEGRLRRHGARHGVQDVGPPGDQIGEALEELAGVEDRHGDDIAKAGARDPAEPAQGPERARTRPRERSRRRSMRAARLAASPHRRGLGGCARGCARGRGHAHEHVARHRGVSRGDADPRFGEIRNPGAAGPGDGCHALTRRPAARRSRARAPAGR
jgi:hypothetical protein